MLRKFTNQLLRRQSKTRKQSKEKWSIFHLFQSLYLSMQILFKFLYQNQNIIQESICSLIIIFYLLRFRVYHMEGEKKIDKYQFNLGKMIGQGSYANVYLGKQIGVGTKVAVKVIDKKIFLNAFNLKNIQSEIDIMKMVQNSNIVKLYDIYQTTNNMYIVTEYCEDGDLYNLLKKKRKIPEKEAIKYLKDILQGIQYLHKNGIIHRDLKPANILMKDSTCKLSDFGFAKNLESDDTVMKSIVGTPLYMSPQILQRKKYTVKSDLWSVGLIFYQMLHGRTPWPANNELELINGIFNKKIHFSKQITQKSKKFIRQCLQIDEQNRMSWQQAFSHQVFTTQVIKKKKASVVEDKENVMNNLNIKYTSVSPNHKTGGVLKKLNAINSNNSNIKDKTAQKDDKLCFTPKNSGLGKKTKTSNLTPNDKKQSFNLSKSPRNITAKKTVTGKQIKKIGLKSNLSSTENEQNLSNNTSEIKKQRPSNGVPKLSVLTPTKKQTPLKVVK